jgi:hypothetical protein
MQTICYYEIAGKILPESKLSSQKTAIWIIGAAKIKKKTFEYEIELFNTSYYLLSRYDRICGLVVGVPGYGSRGPGSIPGAFIFSEK